ncbi:hypothetical protein FPV67DRAFT_1456461 [Lyophyllum atratum]|nr:hypothetical protein FPV67DRAFT_1456461 [Lyophyllum atratum]
MSSGTQSSLFAGLKRYKDDVKDNAGQPGQVSSATEPGNYMFYWFSEQTNTYLTYVGKYVDTVESWFGRKLKLVFADGTTWKEFPEACFPTSDAVSATAPA